MESKGRVSIVVDSAASLPAQVGEDGPLIVPMRLTLNGRTYLDGRDLAPAAFYRMLKEAEKVPTTSSPSPLSFLEAFRTAAQHSSSILCLTVSPRLSSSFDSATTAVQAAKEEVPAAQIAVLDTESAAGGEGLVAMEAWRAARNGGALTDVMEAARAVVSRVRLLAVLDTLYYIWKSGRVPRIAYAGSSLLQLKPVFELFRGEARNIARPRTAARATERMLKLMRSLAGPGPIHATVMHADAGDKAERILRRVESEFACEELFLSEFSAVMGAHTGPGLVGIAFWSATPGKS